MYNMEQIFKNKTMKKEEQKQHLIDIMKDDEELELYEEAAENKYGLSDQYWKDRIGFVHGAKWQAERMYSEEDMEEAFENGLKRSFDSDFDRWFEQFKKK